MLRIKLKNLIAQREFETGSRITITDIAEATGINRMTLSKMANHRGYSTRTDNLDKLCAFFKCRVDDLIEYVPDDQVETATKEK